MAAREKGKNRVLVRILALLFGLGLVGLVELGFRLFTAYPPSTKPTYRQDPSYLYFHEPDSVGWEISAWEEFGPVRLAYNEHGFRGASFARAKPAGERRVFLVGDSFVEARQVKEAASMAAQLQSNLATDLDGIRVVNAGCSAYTTTTEFLLLKHHLLQFAPDAVVVFFAFNDYCDNFWYGNYSAHEDVFDLGLPASLMPKAYAKLQAADQGFLTWLKHNSAIAAWFDRGVQAAAARKRSTLPWTEVIVANQFHRSPKLVNRAQLSRSEQRVLDFTHRGLAEIRKLCQARRIPVLLAILPMPLQVAAHEWADGRSSLGYEQGFMIPDAHYQERLLLFARSIDLPAVDLLPALRAASSVDTPVFYSFDGHLAVAGHTAVASALKRPVLDLLTAAK